MQIGELSRLTGVGIEAIRFYERAGVVPRPPRGQNGRRAFAEADVQRLSFIRRARGLGFGLPAVRTLLDLQQRPKATCKEASHLAAQLLASVENRIEELAALRGQLKPMAKNCKNKSASDCRVIKGLRL